MGDRVTTVWLHNSKPNTLKLSNLKYISNFDYIKSPTKIELSLNFKTVSNCFEALILNEMGYIKLNSKTLI